MRDHLAAYPGDGGGTRYTWADTGLDAAEVCDQVREYQARFDVPTEALKWPPAQAQTAVMVLPCDGD